MSKLFGRLRKTLSSVSDALLAPAEDPEVSGAGGLERQQALLARVQKALANITMVKQRLEAQAITARAALPQLEERARAAVQEGRPEVAKLQLQRRYLANAQLQTLEKQLLEIEREEQRLSFMQQRLSLELTDFYTRQELIAARYSAAEAQVQIGEALTGVSEELAELGQAMAQAERKSAHMQARAAAIERLVEEGLLETPGQTLLPAAEEPFMADMNLEVEAQLALLEREVGR